MTVERARSLRDFTADYRMLVLSGIAVVLGVIGSVLAWLLLSLINLCTNLFYFGKWTTHFRSPNDNHLGLWAVLIPVGGGLLVGVLARFGSDKIRGHGIPEALEAILLRGARVEGRVAILKPIATAISIGSGGPFGAEGPIIVTAGSAGSLIAQLFNFSDAERTTLMVAGAAAGMSATFSTPVAAVLLAVEVLLFEWRPRSLVPVAAASAMAGVMRHFLLGPGPIFPMPLTTSVVSIHLLAGSLLVGVAAGFGSSLLSRAIYMFEDQFEKLRIHWMWWPAIGGIVIGLGGLIFPRALGVGYDVIAQMVAGDLTWKLILGVLIVKSVIWTFSLGSGTAGGVLAPLLMIGGAIGAAMVHILPITVPGGWPLVGAAAMVSGALGAPLTSAVMGMELTHNGGMLLPLLVAAMAAHTLTVLIQPHSILTERLSRRGHHLIREYGVDPLEVLTVRDVMRTSILAIPPDATAKDAQNWLSAGGGRPTDDPKTSRRQTLYPIVNPDGKLVGILTRGDLRRAAAAPESQPITAFARVPQTLSPDATLRQVAEQMSATGITMMPVVAPGKGEFLGMVGLQDMLQARARSHKRETSRERVLRLRWPFGSNQSESAQEEEKLEALDAERLP
jgi:chloride channel protein, CIC family